MRRQSVLAKSFAEQICKAIVDRNCCEQENYEDASPDFVARNCHAKREQTRKQKTCIDSSKKANANIGDSRVPSKNVSNQKCNDKSGSYKNHAFHFKEKICDWKRNSRGNAQCFVGQLRVAS